MKKPVNLSKVKYIAVLVILVLSLLPIHVVPAFAGVVLLDGDLVIGDANGAYYAGAPPALGAHRPRHAATG